MASTEPQYTSKGLPKISQVTRDALFGRYSGREQPNNTDYGNFLTGVQRRLVTEDPVLKEFIESQIGKYPRELHQPMFEIVVGVYGILERQAEANKMADSVK